MHEEVKKNTAAFLVNNSVGSDAPIGLLTADALIDDGGDADAYDEPISLDHRTSITHSFNRDQRGDSKEFLLHPNYN